MMIHFSHSDHVIPAKVIFNFSQISDVVLVMPNKVIHGLDEFIIFYRMINGKWHTNRHFYELYPTTTKNLVYLLQPVFNIAEEKFTRA